MGATCRLGTASPSGEPEFTLSFNRDSCCSILFSVKLFCILLFVIFSFLAPLAKGHICFCHLLASRCRASARCTSLCFTFKSCSVRLLNQSKPMVVVIMLGWSPLKIAPSSPLFKMDAKTKYNKFFNCPLLLYYKIKTFNSS